MTGMRFGSRRGIALLLGTIVSGLAVGCGGDDAPPPPSSEEFAEAQEKQEEILRKEYGGAQ